ncbi:MAG: hypothetical protein WDW36_008764 [Sanguina aurantia]
MGCYNDYHVTPTESAPSSGLSWTWVSWPMRDLPSVSILSDNSIASCGKVASSQGSVLFGMSKSLECWYGNPTTFEETMAELRTRGLSTSCDAPCTGDETAICGGTDGSISMYSFRAKQ